MLNKDKLKYGINSILVDHEKNRIFTWDSLENIFNYSIPHLAFRKPQFLEGYNNMSPFGGLAINNGGSFLAAGSGFGIHIWDLNNEF